MKIKKIILATGNKHKIIELKKMLNYLNIENVLDFSDFNNLNQAEETGKTFNENSKLKAVSILKQTNIIKHQKT